MSELSPSELREREKAIAEIDAARMAVPKTLEIVRKPRTCLQGLIRWFWAKKYTVSDLYWWQSRKWATSEMILYPNAIRHDDIPSKDFPRKHILQGGWTIPSEDLVALYEGPLFDQSGNTVLVMHQSILQRWVSLITQLKPLSWILGFILVCIRYKTELVELLNAARSFI